jgi:hypothetical protein
MTLGGVAKAGVRIIAWCKACQHEVEPDPAELFPSLSESTPALKANYALTTTPGTARRIFSGQDGSRSGASSKF